MQIWITVFPCSLCRRLLLNKLRKALIMVNKGLGFFYPYSLYSLGMRANNPQMKIDVRAILVSCVLYGVIFCALSVTAQHRRSQ